MLTTVLYIIPAILILTTIYVLVRTIIFQWSMGPVKKIEELTVDDQQVAEHLAANDIHCFTSLVMDESFRGLEHGINERIPVQGMAKMVKFYAQLMQIWAQKTWR